MDRNSPMLKTEYFSKKLFSKLFLLKFMCATRIKKKKQNNRKLEQK